MFRQYYSTESADLLLEKPGILSVISFNTNCAASFSPGLVAAGIETLSPEVVEVIEVDDGQIERGISNNCHWSQSDTLIFASVWLTGEDCINIADSTSRAYEELLKLIKERGCPHPLRFWNYVPNINQGDGDRELYKQFCSGRHDAFLRQGFDKAAFPAASALGHYVEGALICVIAAKEPGRHFENPKQQSAYDYPRQYGPKSPSFARATAAHINNSEILFISGTASILGHETQAPESFSGQLDITLQNIQNLIIHVNQNAMKIAQMRVYLRHPEDYPEARNRIAREYPDCPVVYTHADICRGSLLVEIEALCYS